MARAAHGDGAVAVRFFADLRERWGRRVEVSLEDAHDVDALLRLLCDTAARERALFAAPGALRKEIVILVNGRNIRFLDGLHTVLTRGDEIAIFPPVYGG